MSDEDIDNLLDDDPESQYHSPDEIKSVEAMKIEIKMCQIYMKNQKMDEEEGKMKIDSLNSMIELAANQKQTMPEDYLESIKEAWKTHQDWLQACQEDESLGAEKKGHVARIKKRIEKIEEELTSLGVNIEDLKKGDEDDALLGELDSDKDDGNAEDIDELPVSDDEKPARVKKQAAKKVAALPTMEEKKDIIERNSSIVMNNISAQDIEQVMKSRLGDYINAIEYLK